MESTTQSLTGVGNLDTKEPGVLESLYRELGPCALAKTTYLTADRQLAQDILHSVFEKLCTNPVIFSSRKAAYQWIYKSCHHAGIDHLRSKKRHLQILSDAKDVIFTPPVSPQDRIANQQSLRRIVGKLDERQAAVLAYLVVDGLTHAEIADLIEVSEKTVQRIVRSIDDVLKRYRLEVL